MTTPTGLLTRRELAAALPAHPRSIARWLEEGLPVAERGRGGHASKYSLAAVRTWLRARETTPAADLTAARIRRETALATEAEQRIAVKAKNLIPIDEVEKTWGRIVAAVRARLLSMPTALSGQLHRAAVTDGEAAVEAVLQEGVYDALRELADSKAEPRKPRKRPARKARTRTKREGRK
jgi:phage terminase Nu1 subunit (DNA packaging protein)